MTALSTEQQQALREQLRQRAKTLGGELRELDDERQATGPSKRPGETPDDAGDQGEQLQRDEVREAEQNRDAAELADIDAALQRMDGGSYGECIDCGIDIPLARLQAQPAAARCVACQEKVEASGPPRVRGAAGF
jgi:RNA polymerase-binding protein DksA